MYKALLVATAFVLGIAGAIGAIYLKLIPGFQLAASSGQESFDSRSAIPQLKPSPSSRVIALAKLQPTDGVTDLGGIPGDKAERISVRRGQFVKAGDELIVFESRKLRQLERDLASVQLDEATKRLRAEQAYADKVVLTSQIAIDGLALDALELSAQKAKLQALTEAAETARREHERLSRLDKSIASEQQLERAALARNQSQAELSSAEELLKKLEAANELHRREVQATHDQAVSGRAKVDAAVPLESLRSTLALAEERLRTATLRAPTDGVVLELLVDEGDVVGQLPLIRLADVRRMTAVAEVFETQIAAVREKQTCRLTADALPKPLEGEVEQIGSVVGANKFVSLDPRRSTDDRVVEVRIRLTDPDGTASKLIGLQVTAEIDVRTGDVSATPSPSER